MKFNVVVAHYAEIGLKGRNRKTFENLLIENIRLKLGGLADSVKREVGQITIVLKADDYEKVRDILTKIPGIEYLSFAKKCSLEIGELKKEVVTFLKDIDFNTFKVNTCRHYKQYKKNSSEMNILLGDLIVDACKKKVKMVSPDLELKVEISDKGIYLSHESIKSVGGLPTNPKQKVVALLSGGFDSPVAAFMLMKRGCEVILVHFQNQNQVTDSVKGKIAELARQLSKFQTTTVLYTVPFADIQKKIIMNTKAEVRMLVYRRFMIKIASEVAKLNNARFLVTGDSLSQVSSQTIENLEATYDGSGKYILAPLIGLNKNEIMDIARRIGTYGASEQPYPDCCSYFLPKHPRLRATAGLLRGLESQFDMGRLVAKAVGSARVEGF